MLTLQPISSLKVTPVSVSRIYSNTPNKTAVAPVHFGNAGLAPSPLLKAGKILATGLASDVIWLGLFNLLLPLAIPITIALTIGGMMLSRHLGLKYDRRTNTFTNFQKGHPERSLIKERIHQIENKIAETISKPLKLFPAKYAEQGQFYLRRSVKTLRRYLMRNQGLAMFLKVPASRIGMVGHMARCALTILALILKNRITKGFLGRALGLVLGWTAFKQMKGIFDANPIEMWKAGSSSNPKYQSQAVEKAYNKIIKI